jgi:sigma-B regulation protein RsbU (phosphoserine phosphatase)
MVQQLLESRFSADAEELKTLREAVRVAVSSNALAPPEAEKLVLAVNEACMNVIQHAYKDQPNGEIIVEILDHGSEIEVRITDFAAPVDPKKIRPRSLTDIRPGGLGTHFMRELMDDVTYLPYDENTGNRLVMRKHKQHESGGTLS